MCVEKSFLKWVGSKNRLIPQLLPHLRSVAANGNRQPVRELIGVLTPEMIN